MQTNNMWYSFWMRLFLSGTILLLTLPLFVFSADMTFVRNLSLGMKGEDVRALQVFLNSDLETRVAEIGLGSKGNETDYFGTATKSALVRFQEKYRKEVLTPIGLISGTGFLGLMTRGKINALVVLNKNEILSIPKEIPTLPDVKNEVIVMFPSQYSGKPGTMITVSGAGFTLLNNTIYFGADHAVVKATSWNGQSISFKIPSIPKGIYSLFVKNSRGESNKDQFFVVTDGVTPEPKIENINPSRVIRGETITIKGAGFLNKGNMLRASFGTIENVESVDGTTITAVVPKDLYKETPQLKPGVFSMPMWVYVVNENGVSNGESFILDF